MKYHNELSSSVGLKRIARKAIIFIVLIVAVMLGRLLNTGNWIFRTVACYVYIANEGVSLLENTASLGVPILEKVKDAFIQLRDGKKKDSIRENIEHRQ